jgi:hypothetical protein
VVDREPLIVLMPGGHPLTARDAVCPQDFVGEIFIGGANKATVLRAVTEDYLRRSGLDIKLDHGVEKYGDGHVPGRIHPRAGADARLCQESAALAYDYYLGHANGTTPDGRGLLEHLRREAR